MRLALVALVLVLSACGPAPLEPLCAPGETRSCACTSGAMGAQLCGDDRQSFDPCACDGADGGTELDDAGASSDGGRDVDASEVDAGLRDAGMGYPGECSIVPQSGCEAGEACRLTRLPTGLASECVRAGGLNEGEELPGFEGGCFARDDAGTYDACSPGLVCSSAGTACARYCLVDGPADQCPPLRGFVMTCVEREAGFPLGHCESTGDRV